MSLSLRARPWLKAALAAYWTLCFTLTHTPLALPAMTEFDLSDKAAHAAGYAVLGLLLAAVRRPASLREAGISFGIVLAYAAFDELTQPLVNRNADWADFLADGLGAALGIGSYLGIRRWLSPSFRTR